MSLGEKIRKLRLSKDITQKELADKLNVSFQTVSKWENNINEPDLGSLKKLSNIFNCPINYFFEDDEEKINNSLKEVSKEKEEEIKEEKKEEINKSKRKEYVFLKEDEDLDSNGNVIKKEKVEEEKKEFKVNEVEDYSNTGIKNLNEYQEKEEITLIKKKNEDEALAKVGYCSICLKPVFNDSDYYESKKIDSNGKIENQIICYDCYNKKKIRTSKSVGKCKDCDIDLYTSDEYYKVNRNNEDILLCEKCFNEYLKTKPIEKGSNNTPRAKSKNVQNKKKYEYHAPRNDETIIKWSLILGFIALAITLGVSIYKYDVVGLGLTIGLPILFGYMVLSTIYCLFSDSYISEVFMNLASKVVHFPGLIFTFDLDGIAWLIGMKILFAVIGFLAGLAFILFATFIAIALSFVSYFPLLAYNKTHYKKL